MIRLLWGSEVGMSSIKYRPEIDGLRAIAVTAVLIYHAEFGLHGTQALAGGALGVDIFFVISGYLITSILLREIGADKFSFLGFYERRARRILPALLVVILASLPFAWNLLLPDALMEFSRSVIATLLFAANFFLWSQDSYLAEASQFKPMLHMWSLGVEEQFYIIYPIFLLFLWKFARRHLLVAMCAALGGSLALAQWASHTHPDASFYLLPTRAWELLSGAVLAKLQLGGRLPAFTRYRAALPIIGAALLIVPLFLYTDHIRNPNLLTAIPVLGTILLIAFAGGRDIVSAILKSWPFVAVGRISYSLYLWHMPVLVFARIRSIAPLTDLSKIGLLTLCVLLATATWFCIERPFRGRDGLSWRHLLAFAGSSSAVALLVCGVILLDEGFASRYPPIIAAIFGRENTSLPSDDKGICMRRSVAEGDYCTFGRKDAPVRYFSVGDSHMMRFSMALIRALPSRNAQLASLEVGTCPYGLRLETARNNIQPKNCIPKVNETRRRVFLSAPPSVVFVGSRLPWYLGDDPGQKAVFILRPVAGEGQGKKSAEVVAENIRAAISELLDHGHKVVLIYPVPTAPINPARYLARTVPKNFADAREWLSKKSNWLVVPYGEFKRRAAASYRIYDSIPEDPHLLRIYPEKMLCNTLIKGACITHDSEKLYYLDNDHLSFVGNRELLKSIFNKMDKMWPEVSARRN